MTDAGDPENPQLRQLPLRELHEAAGARFGAFAGWSMPITYPAGVMKEHLHARAHAGLFDISHMRLFRLSGAGSEALLARACPVEPDEIELSQSKYTLLLNEAAGIIDDLIVTRLGRNDFIIVANAGNAATDEGHLVGLTAELDARIEPLDRVFLALQGPEADAVLKGAGLDLSGLTFMHGLEPRQDWFASRSGYTGEDGFEIALPAADARELAGKLLADGRVMWVGLAARDSLRLEAGLCLHGQDMDAATDPATAALMWAIPQSLRHGGRYMGAAALAEIIALGTAQKRVGLKPEGRQPVRHGALLFDEAGNAAGRVTSGGFGPSVGHPVAMGYVVRELSAPGSQLFADVRGNRLPISVHSLPFTPHRYRKG